MSSHVAGGADRAGGHGCAFRMLLRCLHGVLAALPLVLSLSPGLSLPLLRLPAAGKSCARVPSPSWGTHASERAGPAGPAAATASIDRLEFESDRSCLSPPLYPPAQGCPGNRRRLQFYRSVQPRISVIRLQEP